MKIWGVERHQRGYPLPDKLKTGEGESRSWNESVAIIKLRSVFCICPERHADMTQKKSSFEVYCADLSEGIIYYIYYYVKFLSHRIWFV